jgi:hypothetical protein
MNINTIIIDNFYSGESAMETREHALTQNFHVTGNFPGKRTSTVNPDLKDYIQNIVRYAGGQITNFDYEYNTAYQYTTGTDTSWIHADQTSTWAGVCYLTPQAPVEAGTELFRHKATGNYKAVKLKDNSYDESTMAEIYKDSRDYSKWDLVDKIGNKFNRLVLYRGDLFHCSAGYFGKDIYSGRLFQTFFFDTEY